MLLCVSCPLALWGACLPSQEAQVNSNPGKNCLLFVFLSESSNYCQFWPSCRAVATLWHGLDAPVAPGQLRAWWGLRLKCLESAFGMSSVRNNWALVKLLQLLTLLKEGLKPIPWPPAYIIYVWPLPSFHEFTAEGQERCESTLT